MPSLVTLQTQCRMKIEDAYIAAEKHYGREIKRVPVVFSNQQVRTAGTASYRICRYTDKITTTQIKLANKLLSLNPVEFVKDTPGHEAAHIIALELFGIEGRGHGRRWKEVMNVIGLKAQQYHNMETPTAGKVAAQCDCMTHHISKQRAGKMRNGTASYRCGKCKGQLRITNIVTKAVAKAKVATPKAKTRAKVATPSATSLRNSAPKVSNASIVRAYITANYATLEQAQQAQGAIVEWASALFKTRSAATSCVKANTPKVFK